MPKMPKKISKPSVTINETATSMVYLYLIPKGYAVAGLEDAEVEAVQAVCSPWEPFPNKLDVAYTATVEDVLRPAPGINIPLLDRDVDLAYAENVVYDQVVSALAPRNKRRQQPAGLLQHSFCCGTALVDVPKASAGREGVQLLVWCFFDEPRRWPAYTLLYFLHIDGKSRGQVFTLNLHEDGLSFRRLKVAALEGAKLLTDGEDFMETVAALEKQVVFPGLEVEA